MKNTETLLVSFLEESDHVITENAKAGIRNAWNDILKNQVEKYKLSMKINFSQLIDVLNLAEEITETITIPTLEKLRKDGLMFTPTKIMILDCSEIKSINPSYLRKYVDDVTSLVARSISNDTTALKMVKELTDGTFNAEHKRRMVDAKFSPYMKSKK